MKKKILTLALVLSLLLALVIPASVAMAAESVTNSGTGTVGLLSTSIDVSAPGDFGFGTFVLDMNTLDPAPDPGLVVIVPGNDGATGYTVSAKDPSVAANPGCMLSGATPLLSELEISDGTAWANASTGLTYTGDLGGGALVFDARQNITGTELAGEYTITIEFAGQIDIP